MIVLDSLREMGNGVIDKRKRMRAVNLEIGDLVFAQEDARGFYFTLGEKYSIKGVRASYEIQGICNPVLKNVLFKLADDHGTLKEVSYRMFRY